MDGRKSEPGARDSLPFTLCDGRYHLVSQLGEGGTSRVYLGLDTQRRTWRAVKILLPEMASHGDLRRRLEAEAQTMKALDHPNVLRVFAAGRDGDRVWFAMEHAARGSLDDWVAEHGPLPPRAAADAMLQVCAALAHAHAHDIVHRDVTPRNVLLFDGGVCKVADFGIARILEHRITRTGMALGTLGYVAPEQLDSAKHVDGRADVYAVGACLYRILTGTMPRDLFLLTPEAPRLEGVPEVLRHVILRATRHRRERRYADVAALEADLRRALCQLPEPAEPHPFYGAQKLDRTPPPVPPRLRTATLPSAPSEEEPARAPSALDRIAGLFRRRKG